MTDSIFTGVTPTQTDVLTAGGSPSDAPAPGVSPTTDEPTALQLEQEGDIAIDARGGRAYVSVDSPESDNLRLLSKPDTVNALQELARLAVQAKTGSFSRLILDVGGSRDARAQELLELVEAAEAKLDAGSPSAALPSMSSYERKLVHDLVAERGLVSASEGEGPARHTVISRA